MIRKQNLPKKTCFKCKRPFFGEKNGNLIGIELNIVQKNARINKDHNNSITEYD